MMLEENMYYVLVFIVYQLQTTKINSENTLVWAVMNISSTIMYIDTLFSAYIVLNFWLFWKLYMFDIIGIEIIVLEYFFIFIYR